MGGDPSGYQEDHLISLELGGDPTDPRNLWPEPRPHAEEVDRIENQLNGKVCSGEITLAEAAIRLSLNIPVTARAAVSSGLSRLIAVETTTTSAPSMFSAL